MSDPSPERTRASRPRRGSTTRWVAGLLLVPSVPLLLLSVAALGLFYVAPQRFGELLERLPGDQYLRSALAFAPAVLLAFVVLAILYALERPEPAEGEGSRDRRGVGAPGVPAAAVGPRPQGRRPSRGRRRARRPSGFALALLLATPAFLASAVAAAAGLHRPRPVLGSAL